MKIHLVRGLSLMQRENVYGKREIIRKTKLVILLLHWSEVTLIKADNVCKASYRRWVHQSRADATRYLRLFADFNAGLMPLGTNRTVCTVQEGLKTICHLNSNTRETKT